MARHRPKDEAERMPDVQRKELLKRASQGIDSRGERTGMRGGRPPGTPNVLPYGAVKALGTAKFRLRKDIDQAVKQDAADVAGYALERMVQVLAGTIHSRKAPTILKAAIAVREETCEPIVKEVKVGGAISLEDMVAKAAKLAAEKKG